MQKILCFIRNIILSAVILYGYNLIAVNFNMMIPINLFSILLLTFLGAPSLVALVLFKILIL